jgi:phage-related protein
VLILRCDPLLGIFPCDFTLASGHWRNRADGCGNDGAKSAGSSGTRVAESKRKMIPFVRLCAKRFNVSTLQRFNVATPVR